MREMFQLLGEVYREDKKEFFGSIGFIVLWALMVYFMFWFFIPTFTYDM